MHLSPRADEVAAPVALDAALLHSWPLPIDEHGDKTTRGTVLVIAGSTTTAGAALLAGVAALRMGAGRLQIATVAPIAMGLSIAIPEALVLPITVDDQNHLVAADAASTLAEPIARAQAILVGPGMTDPAAVAVIVDAIARHMAPDGVLVADAAALAAIATIERDIVDGLGGRLVLTPNREELQRLVDGLGLGRQDDQPGCAAERLGAVVTCFGEIASFDGRRWHAEPATPGLGTSGSGDVLAGLAAGAAARCGDGAQAACWGTYVHAVAGNRLSERLGTMSFIARELLDEVPHVLATLD
ncbi:MAG TPA: NAD(P)H-hydrate dehydratase [Ilumatobacteraceae bacterium]